MKSCQTLVATLVAGLFCLPAFADSDELENIISKASRTPIARARVGSSVSVISRSAIEQRQSLLISDLLQDLPSINVSRAGGPGQQTQLRIRGTEANQLLVMIDGVEVNDPAVGDEFSFEQLSAWDIEKIEVVRGPQSALWGSDAVAGVVNVTTRRASQGLQGSLQAEGGSFSSSNLAARLGAASEQFSINLNASRYDTNGINGSAVVDENDGFTGTREDGYSNNTTSLNTEFRASENLRFALIGRYTDSSSNFDAIGAEGLPVDANNRSDVQLGLLRGSLKLSLLEQRWQHLLSAAHSDSQRENLADGATTDTSNGSKTALSYQTSYDFDSRPGNLRGILAVDYEQEEFQQRFLSFDGADQSQSRDTLGYVAEILAQPTQASDISISVRYDDYSDIKNKTTYRLSGAYRLTAETRLHASLGSGLKQPSFTELFGFFPDSFIGNPELKPEESLGWDIGLEQDFWDQRLVADLTFFSMTLDDEIQTVFTPSFDATVINADGTSRRQGVEFALRARVAEGLQATASYTYTDTKEPDASSQAGKRREVRRPKHMAAINLNYAFLDQRANVNLNLSYTGEQDDDSFPPPFFSRETVALDAYTLVNVSARFQLTSGVKLFARVENLFDTEYQNVIGYRTPGVAAYAGVQVDLGTRP